jgi:hypothetical protein
MLMMAVQSPAIGVGISIVWDRQSGFLRQTLAAPVRRFSLLAGLCLGGATAGALYGFLVLLVAPYAGMSYSPRLLLGLGVVVLIAFTFTALGILAAVTIRSVDTFEVVVSLSLTPLLFLSGLDGAAHAPEPGDRHAGRGHPQVLEGPAMRQQVRYLSPPWVAGSAWSWATTVVRPSWRRV